MPRGIPNTDPTMYGTIPWHNDRSWYVFVRRFGRSYTATSSDRNGGREPTLPAAEAHRDQLMRELPPLTKREFATIRRTTDTSDITGVRHIEKASENAYWTAQTDLPTGRLRRAFSVNVLGEKGAHQPAIEEHQRQLESVTGFHLFNRAATGSRR
jgi:hypothetical protein